MGSFFKFDKKLVQFIYFFVEYGRKKAFILGNKEKNNFI